MAIFVTSQSIFPIRSSSTQSDDENPIVKTSALIFLVAVGIFLTVPTYALGVYPSMPQQIGGGQIIRVETNIANNELNCVFQVQVLKFT